VTCLCRHRRGRSRTPKHLRSWCQKGVCG